jgi:predicted GNAT family N-acyltransferase
MEFQFHRQSQLTEQDIEKIVSLKKIHWDYTIEEHKNWINNNLRKDDIHVLMLENEVLVGYLNLIQTEVILNNETQSFLGIGNVCSKERGKGHGKKILMEVNNYLLVNNQLGILLCKDELTAFYKKYNWVLLDKCLASQVFSGTINVMLFNIDFKIVSFNYTGRIF